MQNIYHTHAVTSRLLILTDELSAGCDAEFDAVYDDLEREFAELRCAARQRMTGRVSTPAKRFAARRLPRLESATKQWRRLCTIYTSY